MTLCTMHFTRLHFSCMHFHPMQGQPCLWAAETWIPLMGAPLGELGIGWIVTLQFGLNVQVEISDKYIPHRSVSASALCNIFVGDMERWDWVLRELTSQCLLLHHGNLFLSFLQITFHFHYIFCFVLFPLRGSANTRRLGR